MQVEYFIKYDPDYLKLRIFDHKIYVETQINKQNRLERPNDCYKFCVSIVDSSVSSFFSH